MHQLERAALLAVTGGDRSSTTIAVGPLRYQRTTSDYQACVAAMRSSAARQYPDTSVWPFVPDGNAAARARAEAFYIGHYCGRPPRR